jgi:hypothetical protein
MIKTFKYNMFVTSELNCLKFYLDIVAYNVHKKLIKYLRNILEQMKASKQSLLNGLGRLKFKVIINFPFAAESSSRRIH